MALAKVFSANAGWFHKIYACLVSSGVQLQLTNLILNGGTRFISDFWWEADLKKEVFTPFGNTTKTPGSAFEVTAVCLLKSFFTTISWFAHIVPHGRFAGAWYIQNRAPIPLLIDMCELTVFSVEFKKCPRTSYANCEVNSGSGDCCVKISLKFCGESRCLSSVFFSFWSINWTST